MSKYKVTFDDGTSFKVIGDNIYRAECLASMCHYNRYSAGMVYERPKTISVTEIPLPEWEVVFEDGEEFIVSADSVFDATCEAESEYINKHSGFNEDDIDLPLVKSCVNF